ncbi:MAG: 23S rRNA (guanosine(2251)-2'-O)-methyltransferase RlmB [Candidatus Omnitrophota bacterium]
MFLYGKNQIIERIKANPQSIKKIYLKKSSDFNIIKELAEKNNIQFNIIQAKDLSQLSQHYNSQGVAAEIDDFVYADLDGLLNSKPQNKYTFIVLSHITDTQNLGVILRTAACFGEFALIIPRHRSVSINETVLRIACGGENYVPVVLTANIIPALEKLKQNGYWVSAAVTKNGQDILKSSFTFPLCIVIGSEDKGIRPGVLACVDFKFSLPMPGQELSLNAAVATSILCYEITRQKQLSKAV